MAVQTSYPGVYIEEFAPAAPIQGVGTSTVAFLGVCPYGNPKVPTRITSWEAFLATFTSGKPVKDDPPADDDHLWYAVQGFFQNGGQVCYVTAISNATPAQADLKDQSNANTLTVTARKRGVLPAPVTVSAAEAHAVAKYHAANTPTGARLFAPSATGVSVLAASRNKLTFATEDAAAPFLAGERIEIKDANHAELATVGYRVGRDVFVTEQLANAYGGAAVKLAPGDPASLRVAGDAAGLAAGSIVTLEQNNNPAAPKTTVVTGVARQRLTATLTTYAVAVKDDMSAFDAYGAEPVTVQSEEFNLTVTAGGQPRFYERLSMSATHARYYETIVNNDVAGPVVVAPYAALPNTTALPRNRPSTLNGTVDQPVSVTGGTPFDRTQIVDADYADALRQLEANKEISLVVTDSVAPGVQALVLMHCETLHDRFAIFAARRGTTPQGIAVQRAGLESERGMAALYYPWIVVSSARTSQPILVPPAGHVAGLYARIDGNRGVFKAPAGTEATVGGALDVETRLNDADHGVLNMAGINVVRVFQPGERPVVWGARTTTTNTNWQYVNVRRLFIFLEESIKRSLRGALFEPNNLELWQKLKRTIAAFLAQQWRDGALFGATEKDAFYVRIDETLNPPDQRALGRLMVEIGVKPSYPAEFIVVRIGIWPGGSDITE